MKRFALSFLTIFRLISRIPLGKKGGADFTFAGFFLPLIGLIVTAVNLSVYFAVASVVGDAFFTAVIIISVQYYLFNLFHLDGLLDSADAFSCYAGRERRREILKDVHLGSFAFFTGVIYLAVKLYVMYRVVGIIRLSDTPISSSFLLVLPFLSYPVTGRAGSALLPLFLKPAFDEGLGSLFTSYRKDAAVAGIILALAAVAIPVLVLAGFEESSAFLFLPFCGIPAGVLISALLYRVKLGGITGDGYGLTIEIGELIHLCCFYLIIIHRAGGLFGR